MYDSNSVTQGSLHDKWCTQINYLSIWLLQWKISQIIAWEFFQGPVENIGIKTCFYIRQIWVQIPPQALTGSVTLDNSLTLWVSVYPKVKYLVVRIRDDESHPICYDLSRNKWSLHSYLISSPTEAMPKSFYCCPSWTEIMCFRPYLLKGRGPHFISICYFSNGNKRESIVASDLANICTICIM